ncbi:hypothetical protein SAMN05216252_1467 [Actinacidiphila glaucinigra]|uniref:Uncharacterized protein n=1 Tax=Actinacidiphila glaucinigra TaxID=235986 RepID=A0A239NSK6_9ACTN|nr:hypothetical protein SAMN05216252_1467 [Actinacidiphila glaucinigra]
MCVTDGVAQGPVEDALCDAHRESGRPTTVRAARAVEPAGFPTGPGSERSGFSGAVLAPVLDCTGPSLRDRVGEPAERVDVDGGIRVPVPKAVPRQPGGMLWFTRNMLVGSYAFFVAVSRRWRSAPWTSLNRSGSVASWDGEEVDHPAAVRPGLHRFRQHVEFAGQEPGLFRRAHAETEETGRLVAPGRRSAAGCRSHRAAVDQALARSGCMAFDQLTSWSSMASAVGRWCGPGLKTL